jgi:HEAT repeat protein
VVVQARERKLNVYDAAVAALVKDPHVLVRREAIRALAGMQASSQLGVIEGALSDPESSVRIAAAEALAKVNGPNSVSRLLAALPGEKFQFKEAAVRAFKAMKSSRATEIAAGLRMNSPEQKIVALRALDDVRTDPITAAMVGLARTDPDFRVRWYAVQGLSLRREGETVPTLFDKLNDAEPAIQIRAAGGLAAISNGFSQAQVDRLLNELTELFKRYGQGSTRTDRDWGWRVVGMALNSLKGGPERLQTMMSQRQDLWTAWHAYQVLHYPVRPHLETVRTEAEAVRVHQQFAPPSPGRR